MGHNEMEGPERWSGLRPIHFILAILSTEDSDAIASTCFQPGAWERHSWAWAGGW